MPPASPKALLLSGKRQGSIVKLALASCTTQSCKERRPQRKRNNREKANAVVEATAVRLGVRDEALRTRTPYIAHAHLMSYSIAV